MLQCYPTPYQYCGNLKHQKEQCTYYLSSQQIIPPKLHGKIAAQIDGRDKKEALHYKVDALLCDIHSRVPIYILLQFHTHTHNVFLYFYEATDDAEFLLLATRQVIDNLTLFER